MTTCLICGEDYNEERGGCECLKDLWEVPRAPSPLDDMVICPVCDGDGKETCTNPDHGFIGAVGGEIGRLGCPGCGHDPYHKVPNGGDCEECNGTGKVSARQAVEYLEGI